MGCLVTAQELTACDDPARSGIKRIAAELIYLHADMKIKEAAMNRTTPTGAEPGRYKPTDDKLMTFLQNL